MLTTSFVPTIYFRLFLPLIYLQGLFGGDFHVCTVASAINDNLNKLIESCTKHHIDLEIQGLDLPYYGNGTKLLRMNDYLETLPDDDIVMFVDGYDVLIVADKELILEKFLKFNAPFVMSAERSCWPNPKLASNFPGSGTFRFLNSGGYIGYVKNLKSWLQSLKPFDLKNGDQLQIMKNYINNRDAFILDTQSEIFLSLLTMKKNELAIDPIARVVRCLITATQPAVIHANGRSFSFWNQVYDTLVAK